MVANMALVAAVFPGTCAGMAGCGDGSSCEEAGGSGGAGQTLNGNGVAALAFSPDGRMLAVAGFTSATSLWDVSTGQRVTVLSHSESDALAFSPNGKILAIGGGGGPIELWNVVKEAVVATITDPGSRALNDLAFSPDGKLLAVANGDGRTYLFATGQVGT